MEVHLSLRLFTGEVKGEDLGEERTVLPMGHYLLRLTVSWKTSMVTGSRAAQSYKQLNVSKN